MGRLSTRSEFLLLRLGRNLSKQPCHGRLIVISKLVHPPNGFRMLPGREPLNNDDVVNHHNRPPISHHSSAGLHNLLRGLVGNSINMDLSFISQFLNRGTYTDYQYQNRFPRMTETPIQVHIASRGDVAVLRSKSGSSSMLPILNL